MLMRPNEAISTKEKELGGICREIASLRSQ